VSDERARLIESYWLYQALSTGDRAERLRADDLFWAWESVEDAMTGDIRAAMLLIDELLAAPGADPCYLGAGPLEDLLTERGTEAAEPVAARCRSSSAWRAAVACVWLDEPLAELEPFLGTR
jgi:hypothetical protein